jgi:hypothetical protein
VRHVDALVTELLPDLVHTIDAFKTVILQFKESHKGQRLCQQKASN